MLSIRHHVDENFYNILIVFLLFVKLSQNFSSPKGAKASSIKSDEFPCPQKKFKLLDNGHHRSNFLHQERRIYPTAAKTDGKLAENNSYNLLINLRFMEVPCCEKLLVNRSFSN